MLTGREKRILSVYRRRRLSPRRLHCLTCTEERAPCLWVAGEVLPSLLDLCACLLGLGSESAR